WCTIRFMAKPPIASREDWQRARDELLLAEKEATRAQDAIAAKRRRLPMVAFDSGYVFDTVEGQRTLLELFGTNSQLVTYQFMDVGADAYCPGCTWFTDNVPAAAPGILNRIAVSWWTVSDMPLEQLQRRATE